MSERFSTSPGQVDPTIVSEEMLQQQNAIRQMVDARAQATPVPDGKADRTIAALGLEEGKYDVFTDSKVSFDGGFTKAVSKEDPSDSLVGVSWTHVGGALNNLNRYINDFALRPNGDIFGRIWVENSDGQSSQEVSLPAHSSDPEVAKRYQRHLESMHSKAQELIAPRPESPQRVAVPESTQRATKGRISRWLGRSSLS